MPGEREEAPGVGARRARLVIVDPEGPVLIEGPVTLRTADGRTVTSERFTVAVCTCRRSRTHPWCDTSHRRRERISAPPDEPRPEPASPEHRPEDPTPREGSAS